MARPKKVKEALQELPKVLPSEENTAAENEVEHIKNPSRPSTNLELYVQQTIQQIKQEEMAENFKKSLELRGTRKVTIRVERDVYDFYKGLPLDCTTAMKKALRIVMDAAKAQNIKF